MEILHPQIWLANWLLVVGSASFSVLFVAKNDSDKYFKLGDLYTLEKFEEQIVKTEENA